VSSLQLINLLDSGLRPPPELLPLRQALMGLAIFGLALGVYSAMQSWRLASATQERGLFELRLEALKASNETLSPKQGEQTKLALVARLEKLQAQRAQQTQMLRLAGRLPDARLGFSEYLEALAEHHPPGLWLKGITLSQDGERVRLEGRTFKAELVPKFLTALASGSEFAGARFDNFEVSSADDGGPLTFSVFSEPNARL